MEATAKKILGEPQNCYRENVFLAFLTRIGKFFCHGISIIIFVLVWELGPRLGLVPETFIAPPTTVIKTLVELLLSGVLIKHIEASLFRAVLGFFAAAVIGIPLGFFFRRLV